MWTASEYANNYSVYSYHKLITDINNSLSLIIDQTAVSPLEINDMSSGIYYYIAMATNNNGKSLSNCIKVTVEIIIDIVPGYNLLLILLAMSFISIFGRKKRKLKSII